MEVVSVGNPLDGVEVIVPENAFSELTLLSVARAPAELPMPNRLAPVLEGFIIDADIRPERDVLARIPVPDDDADGLIDGTELEPHQIDLYRYIPESDTFRLVRTLYDEASRSFEATVDHFSYFRFASIIRYDRDQTLKYRISRFPEHLASGYTAENVKASIRRAFDIYEQELDCYGIDFEETDGAAEFTFQLHKSLAATGVDADIQRISMHLGDVG